MASDDLLDLVRGDGGPSLSTLRVVAPPPDEVIALAPGAVKKPETLNYRSKQPEPNGLFDEAIFGPFVQTGPAAPPDDAPTGPLRFGRIHLAAPVLHPVLWHRSTHHVARRAGLSVDELAAITRCEEPHPIDAVELLRERCPEVVLVELPVLPVELRPMRFIGDETRPRWATADVNDLYRRMINRSNRLARLVELAAPEIIIRNERRMLYEAVHALMDNEVLPAPVEGSDHAPLRSLSAGFVAAGGWDAIVELDRLVAADRGALAGPLPFRVRSAAAHLFALGFDLRPVSMSAPVTPGGPMPVPY